ncbi:MAG: WxcM-like domain-containing protein [Pseudomonadales bacterium]|nr:WxcM-like domain-containing protein [Pseudomonadales bacterium]
MRGIISEIHALAIVERGATLGKGSKVWAYSHVLEGAVIGDNCNIANSVFIANDVRIGDRVMVKSGVQLCDGVRLDDDVFVGANATFTDDDWSRSKFYPRKSPETYILIGASIGANSTIVSGITVGSGAMVRAGAVVTADVPPKAIVVGNPAMIVGYMDTDEKQTNVVGKVGELERSQVKGVKLHQIQNVKDLRGDLAALEWRKELPFNPKRIFFVYNVPNSSVRGEHAHKRCHQFLLCVRGSIAIVVDDGNSREEFLLCEPHIGIHIPPKVWGIQYKYSSDAVLVVLASHEYDADDYIRNYDDYLVYIK